MMVTKIEGQQSGDLTVTNEAEQSGQFNGNLTAGRGADLTVRGQINGDLRVLVGGQVTLRGQVNGNLVNGGHTIIHGQVDGKFVENGGTVERIKGCMIDGHLY